MNPTPQKGTITTRKIFVAIGKHGEGYVSRIMHGRAYWTPALDLAQRFADKGVLRIMCAGAFDGEPEKHVQALPLKESLQVVGGAVNLPGAPEPAEAKAAKPKQEPPKEAPAQSPEQRGADAAAKVSAVASHISRKSGAS